MILKQLLSTSAGELSPRLSFRNDLAKYADGCRTLENFIPTPQGAAMRRPGTETIMVPLDAGTRTGGRLFPMKLDGGSHAVLVFGGGVMEVIVDRVHIDEDPAEDPLQVAIPWSDAELPVVRFRQINNVVYAVHPGHAPRKILRLADDEWEIIGLQEGPGSPVLPVNLDATRTLSVTEPVVGEPDPWAGETMYEVGAMVTYEVGEVEKIFVATVTHYAMSTNTPAEWYGPPPTGYYLQLGVQYPLWEELTSDGTLPNGATVGIEASWPAFSEDNEGSVWRIDRTRADDAWEVTIGLWNAYSGAFSDVLEVFGQWNIVTQGTWDGLVELWASEDNGSSWRVVRSWGSYTASGLRNISDSGETELLTLFKLRFVGSVANGNSPRAILSAVDRDIPSWVRIDSVTDSNSAVGTALSHVRATDSSRWFEAAWSDAQGYPRCVEPHQGRVIFAGTDGRPHTVWGSAVDDYDNFRGGTESGDSWAHTIVAGEPDPIEWMASDRHLMLGTGGAEFAMYGQTESAPITPEHGVVRRQSSYGADSRGVAAIPTESVPLFIQRGGDRLMQLDYVYDADRFNASNLCLLADHIHRGKVIADISLQRVPFQILWAVDTAGGLSAMTYERGQQIIGWHRHTSPGCAFKAVAVARGEGSEDHVYFLTLRDGALAVEAFGHGQMNAPAENGVWTDATVTYDEDPLDATLDALFGEGAWVKTTVGTTIRAGLPFSATYQPMPLSTDLGNGTSRSRELRVHALAFDLEGSHGGWFGPAADNLLPIHTDSVAHNGHVERSFDGGYDWTGDLVVVADSPAPFILRGLVVKFNAHGDR